MAIGKKTAAKAAPAAPAAKAAPAKNSAPAAPAKNTTVVKDGKKTAAPAPAAPAEVALEGNTYRKGDIAEYIQNYIKADGKAIPLGLAKLAVEAYEQFIQVCLRDGDTVVTTMGKFYPVDQPEREGRNPATGETITIAARRAPKVKISATLKKAVNGEDAAEGEEGDEGEEAAAE